MPTNSEPYNSHVHTVTTHATSSSVIGADQAISTDQISITNSGLTISTDTDGILRYTTTVPDYFWSNSSVSIDYSVYLEAALRSSVRECLSVEDHKKLILQIVDIYNEVLGHDCVSGDYVKFEFDEDEFNKILGDE